MCALYRNVVLSLLFIIIIIVIIIIYNIVIIIVVIMIFWVSYWLLCLVWLYHFIFLTNTQN